MVLELVIDTEAPAIDRDHNDFLQYQHRVDPESDVESSYPDDGSWHDWVTHPRSPFVIFVVKAWQVKTKCAAVLSRASVLRPKLKLDDRTGETGKCKACGEMQGFVSLFAEVEMGASAGCPSCTILMRGARKYCPDKMALWGSGVRMMGSWNSGCPGRQFIRTKNVSADLHGAMSVTVAFEGRLDFKDVASGPEGYVMRMRSGLPDVKQKSTNPNEVPSRKVVELNFFGTRGNVFDKRVAQTSESRTGKDFTDIRL